jgi:S1-C subfamily serine protease
MILYRNLEYPKVIEIPKNIPYLAQRPDNAKKMHLSTVDLDVKPADYERVLYNSYKKYKKDTNQKSSIAGKETFQLTNTIFSSPLNVLLKEKGYIDTTNRLFQGNTFLNTISIEATVKTFKITECLLSGMSNTSIISDKIGIKWVVYDSYKKIIYTQETKVRSSDFPVMCVYGNDSKEAYSVAHNLAIKDALEIAFIEFINSEKMQALLMDKSSEDAEANFEELAIAKSAAYVSNMQDAVKASVTIKPVKGHGSGFFITSDGYIITNYHVVSDTGAIKVITNDEKTYDAKIVRVSKVHDLALLKINIENVLPFQLNASKEIEIASEIYAIGTPSAEDLSQTVSKGIISSTRKIDDKTKLIQTDVSVNAGNSGGVLTNKSGLALGVVTSKLQGIGIEGVAFAIPAYLIFDALKISVK